jgi:hypothetical protein
MAVNPKQMIANQTVGASTTTFYTVPANTIARVNELLLCNTDTAARTVTVYFVPAAGTAAAANTVLKDVVVAAGETRFFGLDQVLETGGFVQAAADAASVVAVRMSGLEIV